MNTFLIGEKVGMTRMFDAAGSAVGASVIKVLPATVLRLRTTERDGYEAVQVGAGTTKLGRRAGKAVAGQGGGTAYRVIREFPKPGGAGEGTGELSQGQTIGIEQVKAGDVVDVTATSKGKGFQGTVKRHNFSRGPKTHGSRNYRAPGSIGGTGAARVFPGQKMPGRMGAETVTTRNLAVVAVHEDEGAVLLRGAVPGPRGSLVVLRVTGREARAVALAKDDAGSASASAQPADAAAKPKDAKPKEKPVDMPKAEAKADDKAKEKSDDKADSKESK